MLRICQITSGYVAGLALLAACGDDTAANTDTATTTATDATSSDTADTATDTGPANGCAGGLSVAMTGTWGMEETQTALVQVDPFGTMNQVSKSLYLATVSEDGTSISMTLCAWETKDDADLFTTRMGDSVLTHLDPLVRTLHVAAGADGATTLKVDKGIALRGVTLTDPEHEALPTEASDSRVVDQDEDGDAGISLVITGTLQGKLFVVHRHEAALDGCFTAADRAKGLTDWATEQVILGSNPESLSLTKPVATTNPDASLSHFELAKIGDGDDCAALLAARATLFP